MEASAQIMRLLRKNPLTWFEYSKDHITEKAVYRLAHKGYLEVRGNREFRATDSCRRIFALEKKLRGNM